MIYGEAIHELETYKQNWQDKASHSPELDWSQS